MDIQIIGSEGTLIADLIQEKVWLRTPEQPELTEQSFARGKDGNEPYLMQFDCLFANSLPNYQAHYADSPNYADWVNLAHGQNIIRIVEAAKTAADTGQRQRLFSRTETSGESSAAGNAV